MSVSPDGTPGGSAVQKAWEAYKKAQNQISNKTNYLKTLRAEAAKLTGAQKRAVELRIREMQKQVSSLQAQAARLRTQWQNQQNIAKKEMAKANSFNGSGAKVTTTVKNNSTKNKNKSGGIAWVHISGGSVKAFVLPVSPQEVEVKTASTFAKHTIIGLGEIQIPNGSEQTTISWEGILPSEYQDTGYITTKKNFKDPLTIINSMKYFRNNQTNVKLTIDGMLSETVHVSSFTYKKAGKGDYTYSIEWITAEDHKIESSAAKTMAASRASASPANPYQAIAGQTLYAIAKVVYGKGKKWKTLYKKNKKVLKKAGVKKKKNAKLKKNVALKW